MSLPDITDAEEQADEAKDASEAKDPSKDTCTTAHPPDAAAGMPRPEGEPESFHPPGFEAPSTPKELLAAALEEDMDSDSWGTWSGGIVRRKKSRAKKKAQPKAKKIATRKRAKRQTKKEIEEAAIHKFLGTDHFKAHMQAIIYF